FLESDGLITRHLGRGTFITPTTIDTTHSTNSVETGGILKRLSHPPSSNSASVVITSSAEVDDVSPRDMIETRLIIEPAAAAAAAVNATDADIQNLAEIQTLSTATSEMEEFEYHDAQIHRLISEMTHNSLINRIDGMLRALRNNAEWLAMKRRAYTSTQKAIYVRQHGEIIAALRQRSPRAAREAMGVHLEEVRRVLLDL
ncbi:MAG: FCD domain-containing protein, partial [Pseudomonadota bacterium]